MGISWSRSTDGSPRADRAPVVVELFTSEGCSSCPPADALLIQLEKEQPIPGAEIIVLSQHVDYWNRLGWTDPFSSPIFTRRQNAYADAFGNGSVYTPQMVVDGQAEFVGSDASRGRQAIQQAARQPKAHVEVSRLNSTSPSEPRLKISVAQVPANTAREVEVFVAVTEAGLATNVLRGENSGRRMAHTGVVRTLVSAGKFDPRKSPQFTTERAMKLGGDWKRENLRAVALVQEAGAGRILGAAAIGLAP